MALYLPQRWRRQPTGPVRINHGNPVARGIIAAYPMWRGSTWNALGGVGTISGARAGGANAAGEWFDLDGSSYVNRGVTLLPSGTSPFTISWYAVAHSLPSYPSVFCTRPTGTSNPFFVIRSSDASGSGNYRLSAGPTAGVTDIPAWRADAGSLPALAVGMEERMLLTCAGGTNSRTLTDYRLIRNGADLGIAPQVTAYGSLTSSDEFIGWDGGDGKWDGLLGDFIVWNRALSVAEALEYESAPYQIYAPLVRRIYFGVAGSGPVDKSASDPPTVSIDDVAAVAVAQDRSDDVTVGITDEATFGVGVPVTDTPTVSITDAAALVPAVAGSDTATVGITDSAAVAVAVAVTDTPTVSISDASSLETPGLDNKSGSDDVTVSLEDATSALAAVLARTDDVTVGIDDVAAVAVAQARTDDVSVSVSDSAAVAEFVSVAVSDSVSISITDAKDALAAFLAVADESTIAITDDVGGIAVPFALTDTVGVSIGDVSSLYTGDVLVAARSRSATVPREPRSLTVPRARRSFDA